MALLAGARCAQLHIPACLGGAGAVAPDATLRYGHWRQRASIRRARRRRRCGAHRCRAQRRIGVAHRRLAARDMKHISGIRAYRVKSRITGRSLLLQALVRLTLTAMPEKPLCLGSSRPAMP